MKKRLFFIAIALFLAVGLCSCEEEAEGPFELDADKFIDEIFALEPFSDELVMRVPEICRNVYRIEDCATEYIKAYAGGGATPEELVVVKAETEEGAEQIKQAFTAYCERMINSYSDYAPLQVPKLEGSVIRRRGNYVVYCVSNTDASGVINSYFQ